MFHVSDCRNICLWCTVDLLSICNFLLFWHLGLCIFVLFLVLWSVSLANILKMGAPACWGMPKYFGQYLKYLDEWLCGLYSIKYKFGYLPVPYICMAGLVGLFVEVVLGMSHSCNPYGVWLFYMANFWAILAGFWLGLVNFLIWLTF